MEPAVIHPVCETIKEKSVKEAIEMIEAAKQPYVLLGGGCTLSDASEQVREFVKKIDAPVCDTLMGKGVFPGEDPAYTGMLGRLRISGYPNQTYSLQSVHVSATVFMVMPRHLPAERKSFRLILILLR